MIEFISNNYEWLFSGIGVLGISLFVSSLIKKISKTEKTISPTQQPMKIKSKVEKQHIEVTLNEGAFVDVPWGNRHYRICIKNIVSDVFKTDFGEIESDGAEVYINTGGGLVFGGFLQSIVK